MLPSLLSPQSVNGSKTAAGLRGRHLGDGFGCLLAAELPPVAGVLANFPGLAGERLAEWRRCIAEELLLRQACGIRNPEDWLVEFAGVSPFDAAHPVILAAGLRHRSACAVFPLAGGQQDDPPGIGHVWVFGDLAHREERNGSDTVPPGMGFCTVATHDWHGRSWQLAARLACRCLDADAPADAIQKLAREWMVSGRVDEKGAAIAINLGNKLELLTSRRWLLPLDNMADIPPSVSNKIIRSAVDLDAAWCHVTGVGTRADTEQPWPENVDELHILVGGDIKAGVTSALFCPAATRVQLWRSASPEHSQIPADALGLVLARLRPDLRLQQPRFLDSGNLVEAEKALREALRSLPARRPVLFNITSGNRLMSYAVQNAARPYPNILLVYRDADAPDFVFTGLDHSQNPPISRAYRGEEGGEGINWRWLFSRAKPRPPTTAEAMAKNFIASIQASTGEVH